MPTGIAVQKCLCQTNFVKKEEYKNKELRVRLPSGCREYNHGHEAIRQALQTPLHQSVNFLESQQTDKK